MADIHRLPSDEALRSEACAWIARLNAHNASAADKARFEAWRTAHPRHAQAYNRVSMVWRQMSEVGEVARAVSAGQTFNSIAERAVRRSLAARTRARSIALATAATVAVVLCIGWWAGTRLPETLFQTAIGEHASVKLPDGSVLELNSNSRAHIDFNAQARVVRLERGEAYFEVEHDAQRPFWVAAGTSWVGAVGTAFNVDMRATGVRVTVTEGAVKVAASVAGADSSGPELTQTAVSLVRAGQQANVGDAANKIFSLASAQLNRSVAWRQGSIYFKEERLLDVVDEMSRYTTLRIVIEDDSLRDFSMGGTFETNPQGVEALLVNLEEGFGLDVRRDARTVYISGS